jgi:hypothetical protein
MCRQSALFPLVILAATAAGAAEIRDEAGMFHADARRQAQDVLDRIERQLGVPVRIETVASLRSATTDREHREWRNKDRHEVVNLLAGKRARQWGEPGVYVLLSQEDRVISNVLVARSLAGRLPESRRRAIREAFLGPFRQGQFDEGLLAGVEAIQENLEASGAGAAAKGGRTLPGPRLPDRPAPQPQAAPARTGFPTWLKALLLIVVVLLGFRLVRGLFGAGRSAASPRPAGAPGPGGYGPGAPAPSGLGSGGGFFSGMLGGLAGSILGNWGYNRWNQTRHDQPPAHHEPGPTPLEPEAPFSPGGDYVGGDDDAGQGASWDTAGGSPGDWLGGGDAGGDWAGGGDWGGGGSDAGGGGGGDW